MLLTLINKNKLFFKITLFLVLFFFLNTVFLNQNLLNFGKDSFNAVEANSLTYFSAYSSGFLPFVEANIYIYLLFFLIISSIAILPYTTLLGLYGVFISAIVPLFLFSYIFLIYSLFIRYYVITTNIVIGNWFITSINYDVVFDLRIDYLSASFAALTSNIGFFSVSYLFSYFRGEPHIPRLLLLIQFFIISMMIFVFASNLVILFLGWELIGLTSFLLINFWTTKAASLKSSFKALYFNRWSDTFIMLFMFLSFIQFGTLDIDVIVSELWMLVEENFKYLNYVWSESLTSNIDDVDEIDGTIINIPCFLFIFLILGGSIKSAQFLCHLWLPDSMEAPVPASALIHSATLVSAGIYLVIRFTDIVHLLVIFNKYLLLWGAFTALYGGICACSQNDLKRILAYSTISHCGNMFLLASAGFADLTMIYLYIHGYFKALSFLCVGNIIRFYKNVQDLRKMGMSVYYLPLDSLALCISLINLGGLPLTLGFYIKHYVLAFLSTNDLLSTSISVALIGTSITGFLYSLKIIHHVFFDYKKGSINVYTTREDDVLISKYNNSTSYMLTYLFILAFITTYVVCFFLVSLENPEIIESGQWFDGAEILKKNKQPLGSLNFHELLYINNGILPLMFIFLLADYNHHANWRYIITEKNGTLIMYFFMWSLMLYPIHLQTEKILESVFPFLG